MSKRLGFALLWTLACANPSSDPNADMNQGGPDLADPSLKEEAITVQFEAKVGAQSLNCSSEFKLGTGKEHAHPADLRLYVHRLRLVLADGKEVPVSLTKAAPFQSETVALLDFLPASGNCTGTQETNVTILGKARLPESARVSGLRFVMGVPFEENHQDVTKAGAPLHLSEMFWSWNGGYKFLVVEGRNHVKKPFLLHLGSTGCMKDGNGTITSCSAGNRSEVNLNGYSLTGKAVVFNLAPLFAKTDLDKEVACHSSAAQPDCAAFFAPLGLPLGATPAQEQEVFRIESLAL